MPVMLPPSESGTVIEQVFTSGEVIESSDTHTYTSVGPHQSSKRPVVIANALHAFISPTPSWVGGSTVSHAVLAALPSIEPVPHRTNPVGGCGESANIGLDGPSLAGVSLIVASAVIASVDGASTEAVASNPVSLTAPSAIARSLAASPGNDGPVHAASDTNAMAASANESNDMQRR